MDGLNETYLIVGIAAAASIVLGAICTGVVVAVKFLLVVSDIRDEVMGDEGVPSLRTFRQDMTAFRAETDVTLARITHEVTYNDGSSMNDSLRRVERTLNKHIKDVEDNR